MLQSMSDTPLTRILDAELDGTSVARVAGGISPVHFCREYVGSNKPVLITGSIDHWPALQLWNEAYLSEVAGGAEVTAALTPDGRADCPTTLPDGSPCFALPHQQRMPLANFFALLRDCQAGKPGAVPYLQFQNSSLTEELPQLVADVEPDLPWATHAFGECCQHNLRNHGLAGCPFLLLINLGTPSAHQVWWHHRNRANRANFPLPRRAGAAPEAVNLWIGGDHSITSYHRDHYENIYAVVCGYKTFRLLPPTDAYRLALRRFPVATFSPGAAADGEGGSGRGVPQQLEPVLHQPAQQILWSSILPQPLARSSHGPETGGAGDASGPARAAADFLNDPSLPPPLQVTVGPGEVLYLPACWWHEVHQHAQPLDEPGMVEQTSSCAGAPRADPSGSGMVVAVNFWYDMRFDCKYAAANLAETLAVAAGVNEAPPD